MKNTLGKILFILFFEILSFANADLATYSLKANKTEVYLKEAVEITFEAKQKNHTDNMFFFLEPILSQEYKVELLQKEEEDLAYHDKKTTFTFLFFPLKSGKLELNFKFTIKLASDEAVAQIYRGGRNNDKWMDTINKDIPLKPIVLNVKKLDPDTTFIGDFKLTSKIKNSSIHAYESANVTYSLQGVGFDENNVSMVDNIENVTIFSDVTKHFNKATKEGYEIQKEFDYALVGDKNLTIASKEFKCYSPKLNKYYILKTEQYAIKVNKAENSALIDKEDYPKNDFNFEEIKQFTIYTIIFILGFMSAKLLPIHLKRKMKNEKFSDIKSTKTPKELLMVLINNYKNYNLAHSYNDLEALLYNSDGKKSFNTIKKEILERLK